MTRGESRGDSGQMAVELAVLMPVILVVGLSVYNLMRFVELACAFDRIALDAVISQGVSASGETGELVATEAVRACIEDALGSDSCTVSVTASSPHDVGSVGKVRFPISPLLTEYTCVLVYRPWPGSFVIAGVTYASPVTLTHRRTLVVDRWRPGVVA